MQKGRIEVTINREWKFRYFPESPIGEIQQQMEYNDADWQPIALPHTWSTYETTKEQHPFILHPSEKDDSFWWYGWGWYRKVFLVNSRHHGNRLFLECDGVMKYCQIWLNGEYIGEHAGGYSSFSFDITDAVRYDEQNILAIAVSNRRDDLFGGIPPMTAGNFNVYGGIYRDVRLVIKDPLHIPFQGSADHEGGTFVTTPIVTDDRAVVRVRTYVKNDYEHTINCQLSTIIVDPDGQFVGQFDLQSAIPPGHLHEFDQLSDEILKPQLWSPETPALYHVYSIVSTAEGCVVDRYESPLGFRYFHWDYSEKILWLNGQRYPIHGTNRHQEYPWLGDAIPKWMHEMDIHDIKFNLGHNFMRTAHYTQDKLVYDLCDQWGLLVCEEVPNIKNIHFGESIQRRQVVEMIRRDRNHPSIIMWSMGNETNHSADGAWALAEDETRIIHYRHVIGDYTVKKHTDEQMDMENLLRCTIRGWYNSDVKALEPTHGQHTGHEKWQHDMALVEGGSIRGRINMNGVMWIYADHGADREYVNCPLKHVNPKGWVDAYRKPKYMYYLWQAHWSDKPIVFLHPYEWTSRYMGEQRDITVNSNCDYVDLKVNGNSKGRLFPHQDNDYTVVFKGIEIVQGTIVAEGYRQNAKVQHEVKMAREPYRIIATSRHKEIVADRAGMTLIDIHIVDEQGTHVYGATNDLYFEVSGPATMIGPNVLRSDIHQCESLEGTMYIDTPISMPIRSTNEPGNVVVIVSSPGLAYARVELVSIPAVNANNIGIEEPLLQDNREAYAVEGYTTHMQRSRLDGHQARSDENLMHPAMEDIRFPRNTPIERYPELLEHWMRRNHVGIPVEPIGYAVLKAVVLEHLLHSHGVMIVDDYNFLIERYHSYIQTIGNFKNNILQLDQQTLKRYADKIIRMGINT